MVCGVYYCCGIAGVAAILKHVWHKQFGIILLYIGKTIDKHNIYSMIVEIGNDDTFGNFFY